MFIAASVNRIQRTLAWLPCLLLPASLAFALAFPADLTSTAYIQFRWLVWGVPGALIVTFAVALEPHLRLERQRRLLLLGDASFSLYLIHTFVVPATATIIRPLHLQGEAGLTIFLSFGLVLSSSPSYSTSTSNCPWSASLQASRSPGPLALQMRREAGCVGLKQAAAPVAK